MMQFDLMWPLGVNKLLNNDIIFDFILLDVQFFHKEKNVYNKWIIDFIKQV